jgi:hypothetical protein
MIQKKHDDEAQLLRRRMAFLRWLDWHLEDGKTLEDLTWEEHLAVLREYQDVFEPSQVVKELKAIYGKELRG